MNQRNRKDPAPVLHPPRPAASMDLARTLRDLFRNSGESLPRVEFKAGEVLVRDGLTAEGQTAYLVLKGILREEKALPHPEKGLTVRTLFEATPGEIAFRQGLFPTDAEKPALTRVVATEDGEAVCCTLNDFVVNPSAKRLFEDMHRKLQDSYGWFNEDVRAFFEQLRGADERTVQFLDMLLSLADHAKKVQGQEQSPRAILEAFLRRNAENDELRKQVEEARQETTNGRQELAALKKRQEDTVNEAVAPLTEENRRLKQELEALKRRKKSSQRIAKADARFPDLVKELETLRQQHADLNRRYGEVMQIKLTASLQTKLEAYRAFGFEAYVTRLQKTLEELGFNKEVLQLRQEELLLISGDVGAMIEMEDAKKKILQQNEESEKATQWDEKDLKTAERLGIDPKESQRRISAMSMEAVSVPQSSKPSVRGSQPEIQVVKFEPGVAKDIREDSEAISKRLDRVRTNPGRPNK